MEKLEYIFKSACSSRGVERSEVRDFEMAPSN